MTFRVTLRFSPPPSPSVSGVWESGEIAERKFRSWVGTHGSHPSAVIELAEETASGRRPVATWTRDGGEVRVRPA